MRPVLRLRTVANQSVTPRPSPLRETWERVTHHRAATADAYDEDGLTLVEMLVAFTALIVLLGIVGTALTTYLTAGTNVVSSYSSTDQLLPSSIVIQRLIRSQVEPSPTSSATSAWCPTANAPCPPFLTGSVGTTSTAFFANIGDPNGPAKIVMSSSAPAKCSGCNFYASVFTVDQYPANAGTCPFTANPTATCTYSSTNYKRLVDVTNVVNGQATLPNPTTPIFTYNTLNPTTTVYTPNVPTSSFNTCTVASCLGDNIQSVGVDLQVQFPGTAMQENYFVVYRLSSASYLYSPLVG